MKIIVGDIGGTNTRLLFAEMNESVCDNVYEHSYPSQNFNSFTEVVKQFLHDYDLGASIDAACFAIAGPVEDHPVAEQQVTVTNLPWVISEKELKHDLNIPQLKLINDFLAVAIGISELRDTDYITLQEGVSSVAVVNPDKVKSDKVKPDKVKPDKAKPDKAKPDKAMPDKINPNIAVIGAGTGLGAAHLVWQDDHYHAYSSESGHTGFAPENPLQTELLAWMQQQHSHVSLEMLLSGKGLVTIYQFLHQLKHYQESSQVQEKMKLNDAAEVITESALTNGDALCQAALDCFIDIYGAAAGNIALNYYPVAELYIAGGIAAKIKDKMLGPAFIAAFTNKGLLSLKMKSVTIKLVLQDKVGLYGALAMLKRSYL